MILGWGRRIMATCTAIINGRDNTRSQSFAYDALNRIWLARTQATTGANAWGQAFGYDPWGNLLTTALTQGAAPSFSVAANGQNRIVGYCYDAAGNVLDPNACPSDNPHTYAYNAEGQMVSAVAGAYTYTYDGDGQRVKKSSGKLYWYGTNADVLAESDLAGNITDEYVFFRSQRIARRDAAGNVDYYLSDQLGSSRVVTDSSGNLLDDSDFYPFGWERPVASSSGNTYKFTGKERDSESGNDYFGARYYASSMGRMLSPDPVFISADRIADPQGLNLYAYARNNPLTITDPTGLDFYQTCTPTDDNGSTCQQVQNGSSKVWVQGTSDDNGQFTANRIANDANGNLVDTAHGNAAVSGSFDENGVHLNGAQGQFIDGSAQTNVNGSGIFSGIQGQFVSDCGGSCQGRAELVGSDSALAAMEGKLQQQGGLLSSLDLLSGAHNSGTQWKNSNGYVHVILNGDGTLNAGKTEMHFEGYPTGVDVTKFALHMVDTIRDAASGRAAEEKNRVLP